MLSHLATVFSQHELRSIGAASAALVLVACAVIELNHEKTNPVKAALILAGVVGFAGIVFAVSSLQAGTI